MKNTAYNFPPDLLPNYEEPLDWDELFATSQHLAILKIRDYAQKGEAEALAKGIEKLVYYSTLEAKAEVLAFFEELMKKVMLWHFSEEERTGELAVEIANLREEIAYNVEIIPSVDYSIFDEHWDEFYRRAAEELEFHFGQKIEQAPHISPVELFEKEY